MDIQSWFGGIVFQNHNRACYYSWSSNQGCLLLVSFVKQDFTLFKFLSLPLSWHYPYLSYLLTLTLLGFIKLALHWLELLTELWTDLLTDFSGHSFNPLRFSVEGIVRPI